MLEKKLIVSCRKEDLKLVKEVKGECEQEFHDIMLRETNEEYNCELIISETDFLTEEQGGACGGVVLTNENRRIVCANTLKMRLDLVFEELLPVIRKQLFPDPTQ